MAVKIYDTMTTASDGFPLAYAEKINVKRQDGSEDNLQNLFNNGELSGGGGASYIALSQEEYDVLSDEEKVNGSEYRTYDTGHIYKLGIEYGKDGVQISDNETVEDKTWSSKKTSDEIAKVETELNANLGELEKNVKFDADDLNTVYAPNKTITVRTNKNTKNLPPSSMVNFLVTSFAYVEGQYYRITQYCYENSENLSCEMYVRRGTSNTGESSITWSAWKELATMDNAIETIANPTELDTNKFNKNGHYSIGDARSRTNLPIQKVGTLLVFYAGYYVIQEYILNENQRTFMRKSTDKGANWSDWTELATMDKLGGLTFSASGTTLTITNGTNTWTLEANS